jgi:hypothetical protein
MQGLMYQANPKIDGSDNANFSTYRQLQHAQEASVMQSFLLKYSICCNTQAQ